MNVTLLMCYIDQNQVDLLLRLLLTWLSTDWLSRFWLFWNRNGSSCWCWRWRWRWCRSWRRWWCSWKIWPLCCWLSCWPSIIIIIITIIIIRIICIIIAIKTKTIATAKPTEARFCLKFIQRKNTNFIENSQSYFLKRKKSLSLVKRRHTCFKLLSECFSFTS